MIDYEQKWQQSIAQSNDDWLASFVETNSYKHYRDWYKRVNKLKHRVDNCLKIHVRTDGSVFSECNRCDDIVQLMSRFNANSWRYVRKDRMTYDVWFR